MLMKVLRIESFEMVNLRGASIKFDFGVFAITMQAYKKLIAGFSKFFKRFLIPLSYDFTSFVHKLFHFYNFKDFIGRLDTTLGSIIGEHSGHYEAKLE